MAERAMFSLEKKLREGMRAAFKYLKGCRKKEELKCVLCGSTGDTRAMEVASRHTGTRRSQVGTVSQIELSTNKRGCLQRAWAPHH